MSKKWYPVIDYEKCIACGACVNKCCNGVYQTGTNVPKVIYPNGCVDGCRGCQKLCPTESISYIGDTGQEVNCGCSCNC